MTSSLVTLNCYVLFHNKLDCISAEDADAKLCAQIDDLRKKVQESINLNEEMVSEVTLAKKILENDKRKFWEAVKY